MDRNRLWIVGAVAVMAVVLGLGWILGIQPQLANAAAADAQRSTVETTNTGHEASLAKLKKDFTDLDALKQELASLTASVPSGTEIPALVDELDALSVSNSVTISGLTVADAKPYAAVAAPAPAVTPAPAAGATATPAPTTTPTPMPTAPAAGMPPVTDPKITPANFSSLAVTLTVDGDFPHILDFVQGLQVGKRLFLVTGLTTTADTTAKAASGWQTATITGLIYVVTPAAGGSGGAY